MRLAPLLARLAALSIAAGLALGVGPASAQPARPTHKTPEILTEKPSGFWTSNSPAVGGAYRWRLLGIGVVILAITGYGMLRLVRRASRDRAKPGASGPT